MNSFRPPLLLTRPLAASERFADAFRERFGASWPVVIAPLMRTVYLDPIIEAAGVSGVIFTSETAVQAFARLSPDRTVHAWCVGPRTGRSAQMKGFSVTVGPGNAPGLVAAIRGAQGVGRLLYPRGMHIAHDIGAQLNLTGIETIPVTTYDQQSLALTHEAQMLLGAASPILLPLFSQRTAELFSKAAPGHHPALLIVAISKAVAEAARPLCAAQLLTAESPDSDSVLASLAELAKLPPSG